MKVEETISELSCRFFLVFPGCFASGGRRSATDPCADASGASNSQSYNLILPKGLCVFLGGETTIPQVLRASSLYSEKDEKEGVILHFAPKKYRNTKPVQACCFLFCVIE